MVPAGEAAPLPSPHGGDAQVDVVYRKHYEGIDLLKMFPPAFTMVCCLVFLVPTWLIMMVARDPALSYFSSSWSLIVLVIPIVILSVHYVHMQRGIPNKYAVIAGLIVPSVLLLVTANRQYMTAVDKMDKLFSVDCDTFPEKRTLQHAWEDAYNIYTQCLKSTAASSNYSIAVLQSHFRVQDCQEYQETLAGFTNGAHAGGPNYAKEWAYLSHLEDNQYCAGWCYHGQALWSSRPNKDACSVVVSHVYGSHVRPHTLQVAVVMLAMLGVTAVVLIMMGPAMRKNGIDW